MEINQKKEQFNVSRLIDILPKVPTQRWIPQSYLRFDLILDKIRIRVDKESLSYRRTNLTNWLDAVVTNDQKKIVSQLSKTLQAAHEQDLLEDAIKQIDRLSL
jgi:hypothetical protein